MSKKILICDGDSWTAGDLIDPELFGGNLRHVNHPDNDQYRLPRVWPHKLGKLLNVKVSNISVAGSSNDSIIRRIIPNVMKSLNPQWPLKGYKPEEIFVMVGWSSPERKDFYYKGEWDSWETLYPAQLDQNLPNKDVEKFYKLYLKYYWNKEEYMNRYVNQVLYLHYFLERNGIDHLFFNAFYECSALDFDDDIYKKFVLASISGMREDTDLIDDITLVEKESLTKLNALEYRMMHDCPDGSIARKFIDDLKKLNVFSEDGYLISTSPYVTEEFLKVVDRVFKEVSFRSFLIEKDFFTSPRQHPNEMEHQLWAEELYKDLKDKI